MHTQDILIALLAVLLAVLGCIPLLTLILLSILNRIRSPRHSPAQLDDGGSTPARHSVRAAAGPLRVICCDCGKHIRGPLLAVPVSHGICPDCLAVRQTELDSLGAILTEARHGTAAPPPLCAATRTTIQSAS